MSRDQDPTTPAERALASGRHDDWPAQVADTIEQLVATVRDKTTGPAITAARAVVYGTFALLVGTMAAVVLAIAAVRALNNYLPDDVFGEDHVWAAHGIVGAVFSIAGMAMWSRRSRGEG